MNNDATNLYYYDNQNRCIFTARYHIERGTCCFGFCLHCPYGTTVEHFGITVEKKLDHLIFKLKGVICARYAVSSKEWHIEEKFREQDLENDLNQALDTFGTSMDEQ